MPGKHVVGCQRGFNHGTIALNFGRLFQVGGGIIIENLVVHVAFDNVRVIAPNHSAHPVRGSALQHLRQNPTQVQHVPFLWQRVRAEIQESVGHHNVVFANHNRFVIPVARAANGIHVRFEAPDHRLCVHFIAQNRKRQSGRPEVAAYRRLTVGPFLSGENHNLVHNLH